MHEADYAYSIQSTWGSHILAADVPSIACVINWQSKQLGFVELSPGIWIAVFLIFIYLSPVSLFCECCKMSLL